MKRRAGFTLVELNLAMVFIAILLIGVAMTTIYITKIYQKGSTVKTINQIGREVNDQLRRDMSAAVPSSVTLETAGESGRLCLGTVSYVYNTPAALESGDVITVGDDDETPVYFARVIDSEAAWCERSGGPTSQFIKSRIDVDAGESYTELLTNEVIPLAVHELQVTQYDPSDQDDAVVQQLYQLRMQLGTNEAYTIDDSGDERRCQPPSASESNYEYCFVAEFNTIIRAGELTL